MPGRKDKTMKNIIERRFISPTDLRRLCIEENWFTKGDNEAYDRLLGMCRKGSEYAKLTTALIARMAISIQMHSDVEQSDEMLENIMYCIAKASTTCFEIEE